MQGAGFRGQDFASLECRQGLVVVRARGFEPRQQRGFGIPTIPSTLSPETLTHAGRAREAWQGTTEAGFRVQGAGCSVPGVQTGT